MAEMTKEERVVCALSREEPDRVPLYDLVDNSEIIQHYAGEKLTLENAHDVIPRALNRVLDTTRVWMPHAPGRRVDDRGFAHERGDWWNEWQVSTPFHNMVELIAFVKDEIERLEAWQPTDTDAELKDALIWKERFGEVVIPASTAGEALSDAYILVGLDQFVYLESEAPDLVDRWLKALHARTMRRLQAQTRCREVSPIAWVFDDMAYKGRLMFSPRYLRAHRVFQNIAEICDMYHSYGLKVIFHSDGDIAPVVPDLIAAGVDALAPIDTPVNTKVALRSQLGSITGTPSRPAPATATAPPISQPAGNPARVARSPPAAEMAIVSIVRGSTCRHGCGGSLTTPHPALAALDPPSPSRGEGAQEPKHHGNRGLAVWIPSPLEGEGGEQRRVRGCSAAVER